MIPTASICLLCALFIQGVHCAQYVNVTAGDVGERMDALEARQAALEEENLELRRQNLALNHTLETFRAKKQPKQKVASFQVKMSPYQNTYNGSAVIQFGDVTTNNGNHFNATTGYFTAPQKGNYVFLVTVASSDTHLDADVQLKTDGFVDVIARALAPRASVNTMTSSCQGVVDLNRGQRVWVECFHMSEACRFWASATFFAGFLLH